MLLVLNADLTFDTVFKTFNPFTQVYECLLANLTAGGNPAIEKRPIQERRRNPSRPLILRNGN